jgi:hypothetical protein
MIELLLQLPFEEQQREDVFNAARATATYLGKPLLNAGCGGPEKFLRALENSDVNLDVIPREVPNFVLGSIEDLSMFRNKQFGAVFCSHVLEHVQNLEKAKSELDRVSDYQYYITPSPLFGFTWLSPFHRRVFADTRGKNLLLELPPKTP